ncbi:MAG: ATP-binding cassette domain-containing protein [Lachnospiraceae bacterium]|nr:ATP-binding cassette domain-containing protein [Lachnospiraceae bacterium]
MSFEVRIKKQLNNFVLDLDLSSDGNCTGILGESGCGKSMFLKCIAGIERPDSGRIVLDGRVLFDSEKKIDLPPQKRGVGYLFQNYALFPSMTVYDNIAAGLRYGGRRLGSQEIDEIVRREITRCRLEGLEHVYPARLSGGQQQRTALARMLAVEPAVIMLDEPFSALDSHLKETMQNEILEIIRSYSGNTLIVSHSRDELYRLCDTCYVMHMGRFIRRGPIRDVFRDPGHLQASILTGCKNNSPAEQTGSRQILAKDWNLTLKLDRDIPLETTYLGIRAHYFHLDPQAANPYLGASREQAGRRLAADPEPADRRLSADGKLPDNRKLPADGKLPDNRRLPADGKLPDNRRLPADGKASSDCADPPVVNKIEGTVARISESPFEVDYHILPDGAGRTFQWKVPKTDDRFFETGQRITLYLLSSDIMLLHE